MSLTPRPGTDLRAFAEEWIADGCNEPESAHFRLMATATAADRKAASDLLLRARQAAPQWVAAWIDCWLLLLGTDQAKARNARAAAQVLIELAIERARKRRSSTPEAAALRSHGASVMANVQNVLADHGKRFFLLSGSLLGVVRDNGFASGDVDVDVGVFADEVSRLELKQILSRLNYLLDRDFEHEASFLTPEGVRIEFFFCERGSDHHVVRGYGNAQIWRFPAFELAKHNSSLGEYLIPTPVEPVLTANFGRWEQPVLFFDWAWDTPCLRIQHNLEGLLYLANACASAIATGDRYVMHLASTALLREFGLDASPALATALDRASSHHAPVTSGQRRSWAVRRLAKRAIHFLLASPLRARAILAAASAVAGLAGVDKTLRKRCRAIALQECAPFNGLRLLWNLIRLRLRRPVAGFAYNVPAQLETGAEREALQAIIARPLERNLSQRERLDLTIQTLRLSRAVPEDPAVRETALGLIEAAAKDAGRTSEMTQAEEPVASELENNGLLQLAIRFSQAIEAGDRYVADQTARALAEDFALDYRSIFPQA